MESILLTVEAEIDAPLSYVWKCWVTPTDIVKWNTASVDWHTTKAQNDLSVGGEFNYRMEAKDGSFGFNFSGKYDAISLNDFIEITLDDNRKMSVHFSYVENKTVITETFEAENENPIDLQRSGWQAILDNFKKHTECKFKN